MGDFLNGCLMESNIRYLSINWKYFVKVVAVLFIDRALGGCTVNVSPCTCTNTTGVNNTFSININCQNVPVTTVKTVFSGALPYNISQVTIIPNVNDTQIISNITGNHSITTLVLDCSYMANKSLNVNSSAFTLSKLGTTNITIQKCDLSRLSYSFLTGFTNLTTFYIYNSSNFHTTFYTLPSSSLGKLKNFWLNQVKGINGFSNSSFKYPKSIYVATNYASAPITSVLIGNTGTGLNCTDCKIGDTALNSLLKNWIQPSSSMLDSLQLMGNNLTTIPSYVNKYFVYLTVIDFSRNQQPLNIPTNAFYANRPIKTMDFRYSIISNIGDNAFQGILRVKTFKT